MRIKYYGTDEFADRKLFKIDVFGWDTADYGISLTLLGKAWVWLVNKGNVPIPEQEEYYAYE